MINICKTNQIFQHWVRFHCCVLSVGGKDVIDYLLCRANIGNIALRKSREIQDVILCTKLCDNTSGYVSIITENCSAGPIPRVNTGFLPRKLWGGRVNVLYPPGMCSERCLSYWAIFWDFSHLIITSNKTVLVSTHMVASWIEFVLFRVKPFMPWSHYLAFPTVDFFKSISRFLELYVIHLCY